MPTLTLSSSALIQNYRTLSAKAKGSLIPVVKADAYGHGALFAARTLAPLGASCFAVASAYEAKELLFCKELVTKPQVLIMGTVEKEDLPALCVSGTLFSVHSLSYAKMLSNALEALKQKGLLAPYYTLPVHLKIETGMHRLGMHASEARAVRALSHLSVEGIYSHLGSPASPLRTGAQTLSFYHALAFCGGAPLTHLAASGALLRYGSLGCTASRTGLALYGVLPEGVRGDMLLPVMRLDARVLSVTSAPRGALVGYGQTRLWRRTRYAVLDAGYADGVPPSAACGGFIRIKGRRCPFLGQICMDRATVEIGNLALHEGESVTLFGERAGDTAAFAAASHVSPYFLLCTRSARTRRVVL